MLGGTNMLAPSLPTPQDLGLGTPQTWDWGTPWTLSPPQT